MNRDHAAAPLSRRSLAVVMATLLVAATSAPVLAAVGPAGRLTAAGATRSSQTPLAAPAADRAPYARGHVIVGFEPGAGPLQRGVAVASVETRGVKRLSPLARDTVLVRLAPGQTVEEAITEIGASPGVAFVEPDYTLYPLAIPDDPYYTGGGHWGMYGDRTTPPNPFGSGAGEAWDAGYTGDADVYVGVIDEGIQITHPDLAANIWTNAGETAGNGVDDDGNGYIDDIHGWDFVNDDASVYDGAGRRPRHPRGRHDRRPGRQRHRRGRRGLAASASSRPSSSAPRAATPATPSKPSTTSPRSSVDTGLHIVATNNSWGGGG